MTKEIEQIKECLQDKDWRIKRLEDYFRFRNRIIASILATLLIYSPLILLFFYGTPEPATLQLTTTIFLVIGVCTFVSVEFVGWVMVMLKIWK